MSSLLNVTDLECSYGTLVALRGVSLSVEAGQCVCIVGPNGAGKSTLVSNIAGIFKPTHGKMAFLGQEIVGRGVEAVSRLGIALVPEGRRIFGSMSVAENLLLGATRRRGDGRARINEDIERSLDKFPVLRERFQSQAGNLSGGEQQMLSIARALMSRPRLIMIDEPSLGLAPLVVDRVYEVLASLRQETGIGMVLVEQSTSRIADIADVVHVVSGGRFVMTAQGGNALDDKVLQEAYFGRDAHAGTGISPP